MRIATIGESIVADHAGKKDAAKVIVTIRAAEMTNGRGVTSRMLSWRMTRYVAPTDATPPIAIPQAAILNPLPTTSDSRSRISAPSAIRVPISTVGGRTP